MVLGLLGVVVLICSFFAQTLLLPLHIVNAFHLPLPLWLGTVQTWLGLGVVLFISSWLMGDR